MDTPKFEPTKEQITIATNLVSAMAFEQVTKKDYDTLVLELLQDGSYHYDEMYYLPENREKYKGRLSFAEDRVIRNLKDVCHMAGLKQLHTDEYKGTDAERFWNNLGIAARNKGYVNGENFNAIAENNRLKLESQLIIATKPIHRLNCEDLYGENRKKLLSLLLNLYVPLVNENPEREDIQIAYYREHVKIGVAVKQVVEEFLEDIKG